MPDPPKPTDAELDILRVLWDRGPSTVRDVHDALGDRRGVGYTTVLKLMQIMTGKGLVLRDESARSHVYRAKERPEATQRRLLRDLIARAFGGSAEALVLQALATKRATPAAIAEIRKLLDDMERGGR